CAFARELDEPLRRRSPHTASPPVFADGRRYPLAPLDTALGIHWRLSDARPRVLSSLVAGCADNSHRALACQRLSLGRDHRRGNLHRMGARAALAAAIVS